MVQIADRIEINSDVLHGKPRIAGTRIPVYFVLGLLGDGLTPEQIVDQHYPQLTKEDILACVKYGKTKLPAASPSFSFLSK